MQQQQHPATLTTTNRVGRCWVEGKLGIKQRIQYGDEEEEHLRLMEHSSGDGSSDDGSW